jgi:hypothetical protein
MLEKIVEPLVHTLSERALPEGGFSNQSGGAYRPDTTAWATLALTAVKARRDLIESARGRLAADQMEDGRVSLSPKHPQTFWPTPLVVLAWHGSPKHRLAQQRAIQFLLRTTGKHFKKKNNSVIGHDSSIRGWPWIWNTHSWIEPTAMALLALELTGCGNHKRAKEARLMLLNRQLERGGWNFGNTYVFGQQLRPMPESTGIALNALAERASCNVVEKSLWYLKGRVGRLRTPFSLSWSLLGLGAWAEMPANAGKFVLQSLECQNIYGPYDTAQLSMLLVSLLGNRGLLNLVTGRDM